MAAPAASAGRSPRLTLWLSLVPLASALMLALAGLGLAAYAALFVRHARVLIDYPFDIDQGEAYDVWAAWLLVQGQPIYTTNETWPYFSTNYPPLYFATLAPLLAVFGPSLGAGRALSALLTLAAALVVFFAARQQARDVLAALFAALLFLGSTYVYHVGALARVNTLMLFLALLGVFLVATSRRWGLPLGLVALVLAALTKQTSLDALLAVTLFLATRDWRLAVRAALTAGLVGLLAVLALEAASGGAFLLNVVTGNANPWDLWQAVVYGRNFLRVHLVVALAALGGLLLAVRRIRLSVYHVYLATAAIATLGAGKWGAGESYFLELLAVSCVVGAPFLAQLLHHKRPWPRLALGAALCVQLGLYVHGPALSFTGLRDFGFQAAALGGEPGPLDTALGQSLVDNYITRWNGPVLAEDAGFLLAAGKPIVGNTTHLRNLHQAGVWDGDRLVADIRAKRFDYIILNANLYPPPVLAAIGQHYYLYATVPVRGYNYQVFAPGAD